MNFNYERIEQGSILVNKTGYYFDFLVDHAKTNMKVRSNFTKNIVSIENLEDNKVLMYPRAEQILDHFDAIKKHKPIIVLYVFQKQEYDMLSLYFKEHVLTHNEELWSMFSSKDVCGFDNIVWEDDQNISKEALQAYDIDVLLRSGMIYPKENGKYGLVKDE